MSVYSMRGSQFFVGNPIVIPPSDILIASDYAGQDWLNAAGIQSMGSVGRTASTGTSGHLGSFYTTNFKTEITGGQMQCTFRLSDSDPAILRMRAALLSCEHYAFRTVLSAGCERVATVTISNAEPAVVTWAAHGLAAGSLVRFATTGALPTGLTAGTDYYVVNPATDSFSVAATVGGAAIDTSGAGSGVHTATAIPAGRQRLFAALVVGEEEPNGAKEAEQVITYTLLQAPGTLVRL